MLIDLEASITKQQEVSRDRDSLELAVIDLDDGRHDDRLWLVDLELHLASVTPQLDIRLVTGAVESLDEVLLLFHVIFELF